MPLVSLRAIPTSPNMLYDAARLLCTTKLKQHSMGDKNGLSYVICWVLGDLCEADSIDAEECKFTSSHKRFYSAAVISKKSTVGRERKQLKSV